MSPNTLIGGFNRFVDTTYSKAPRLKVRNKLKWDRCESCVVGALIGHECGSLVCYWFKTEIMKSEVILHILYTITSNSTQLFLKSWC